VNGLYSEHDISSIRILIKYTGGDTMILLGLVNKSANFLFHSLEFPNAGRHISFASRLVFTISGPSWSREETPSIFMVISSSSVMTASVLA
jgi:hypothetical protein